MTKINEFLSNIKDNLNTTEIEQLNSELDTVLMNRKMCVTDMEPTPHEPEREMVEVLAQEMVAIGYGFDEVNKLKRELQ